MNKEQMKLENPARLEELRPGETLGRIGISDNDVLCDIGAGTGIFTLEAAKRTKNTVFALEINEDLLSVIKEKASKEDIHNIELIKVTNDCFDIADNSVDIVLLVTVLHEITDSDIFLNEVGRILKSTGKIVIIEFHKYETLMGPPVIKRLGIDEVKKMLTNIRFNIFDEFNLGKNLYCLVFKRGAISDNSQKF